MSHFLIKIRFNIKNLTNLFCHTAGNQFKRAQVTMATKCLILFSQTPTLTKWYRNRYLDRTSFGQGFSVSVANFVSDRTKQKERLKRDVNSLASSKWPPKHTRWLQDSLVQTLNTVCSGYFRLIHKNDEHSICSNATTEDTGCIENQCS